MSRNASATLCLLTSIPSLQESLLWLAYCAFHLGDYAKAQKEYAEYLLLPGAKCVGGRKRAACSTVDPKLSIVHTVRRCTCTKQHATTTLATSRRP